MGIVSSPIKTSGTGLPGKNMATGIAVFSGRQEVNHSITISCTNKSMVKRYPGIAEFFDTQTSMRVHTQNDHPLVFPLVPFLTHILLYEFQLHLPRAIGDLKLLRWRHVPCRPTLHTGNHLPLPILDTPRKLVRL